MATPAQVTAVNLQIPDEAEAMGFDTDAIGALLDSGLSQNKTILAIIRGMSAKAASMASSITENSSSRSVDLFNNLKLLIDYWQGIVDKEDVVAGTNAKEGARIYTAVRV